MKKAFTLMEMMVSIVLLSIIVLFLYETLDMTKVSNSFYNKQLEKIKEQNSIKILMFEDMINSFDMNHTKAPIVDKNDNTILSIQSQNTFHNPFYSHITYLVSREKNLIRCESEKKFDKNKVYDFGENAYIDIVDQNVSKFKIVQHQKEKNNYVVYIQYEDKREIFFTLKALQ